MKPMIWKVYSRSHKKDRLGGS